MQGDDRGQRRMLIPHWVMGLAIFAGLAAIIGYAFRQGMRVKPTETKITMIGHVLPAVRWPFQLSVRDKNLVSGASLARRLHHQRLVPADLLGSPAAVQNECRAGHQR